MIYLDYNATAPVRPEVRDVMMPLLFAPPEDGLFGNASSVHWAGQRARKHLEAARLFVAEALGRKPSEIIFTSGGSESDNLAILGTHGTRILVSAVEHPAVLEAAREKGVGLIPVDRNGVVDLDVELSGASLVSVMAVNNETGVVSPMDRVIAKAREAGVPVHVDAVQAAGRVPIPIEADLISLSGHKLGAPKGIGVLGFRESVPLSPRIVGGPQERGRRAGTEQVAGAVGFAEALRLALGGADEENRRLFALTARIEQMLSEIDGVEIAGAAVDRVANTTTAIFDGVDGESILQALDLAGFAASSGSACSSGSLEPSHVLMAMGYSEAQALSAVRFSLGWATTSGEIDQLLEVLPGLVQKVRAAS